MIYKTNLAFSLFLFIILTSCATLINNKKTLIEIHTNPDSSSVCLDNDSCYTSPILLEIPRNHGNFNFIVKKDTLKKPIELKSKFSTEFVLGNLFLLCYSPFGYFIDTYSPEKIYDYDNSVYIDLTDTIVSYKKWKYSKSNQFYFHSSFPWFNFIGFDNGLGFKSYESYMGLTIGFDYYHSKHSFISLTSGATGICNSAIPAMDYSYDTAEFVKSFCLNINNNHEINVFDNNNFGFSFGYGISCTHFTYKKTAHDTINYIYVNLYKNSQTTIGLNFNFNLILYKYGFIGMNFMPSYFTFNNFRRKNSYLTYFDFGVRLPLGNYNQPKVKLIKYKPNLR